MEYMELCSTLDKHELMHTNLHAGKFIDWRRHELVAGNTYYFFGNTIVLIPMILNGHAGAKYGIPFPVFARASFGVKGANIPAMLRAIVACGWFGIQTWIGGFAIISNDEVMGSFIGNFATNFSAFIWFANRPCNLLFLYFGLLNMYRCLSWC